MKSKALQLNKVTNTLGRQTTKTLLCCLALLSLSSCQWVSKMFGGGSADLKQMELSAKTQPGTKDALSAARTGARIAFLEVKDYRRALFFYKYIVLYSDDEKERSEAQRHLAEIYFERLTDYDQAVLEYNRLLELPHGEKEGIDFRMNIAKSYFYLNKFSQAEAELDMVLRNNSNDTIHFDANLLKANIHLATRNLDGAIEIFKMLMQRFPEQSREEHVGLSLAVCYEEKNDFKLARAVLNDVRGFYPRPDFIDLKIQRLQERESQLPGAQGLRK
jgi:tetratricopeptide (TPR) repeat protein